MAAVEEDSDFASHFLDSMLEVEMTEEDAELDIYKNEDPLDVNSRTLPPIPTFDLQSETLSYKDVYKTPVIQPVLTTIPAAPTTEGVSLAVPVIKPGSVLAVYSGNIIPGQTLGPATRSTAAPLQKISPKLNVVKPVKIAPKEPQTKDPIISASQFVQQVFKQEFIRNAFTKKESDSDTSIVGEDEIEYYKSCFKDVSKVQYCRLHCTICDIHIGCGAIAERKLKVHNMLKVMTCMPCHVFYGDGNFPCDQGDNCEIYCRWCGQGGALVCCSYCPKVFCKKCVRQNFGHSFLKNIQRASDWACFCCAQKPLWPHRAICRALVAYLEMKKTDGKPTHRDTSKCCASALLGKKQSKPVDKNKITVPQTPTKVNPVPKNSVITTTPLKNKLILPVKSYNKKEQSVLKSNAQVKVNHQNKSAIGLKILKESPRTNVITRPFLTGNNIIRGITTSTPAKIFSTIPPAQLIQTPVLHGETLITPPGSRMLAPPKQGTAPVVSPTNPACSSYVRVSLTNQTANLDLNKIPTAKIPHDIQSLILRMSFPDNKVQLVRLISDGHKCKASKQFPMPEFKNLENAVFIEENLSDSFRVCKLLFDNIKLLQEKVNSRTKDTEESVFTSSVEKLHLIYEKSAELLKDLDDSLMEGYEEWKNQGQKAVDVIELSEDEGDEEKTKKEPESNRREEFLEKCQKLAVSDDSDVEILDDVDDDETNANVNVDPLSIQKISVNGNFKQKYSLRGTSIDKIKNFQNDRNARRKKGKKGRKRLKVTNTIKNEEGGDKCLEDQSAKDEQLTQPEETIEEKEESAEGNLTRKRRRKQSLNCEDENPVENGISINNE